jgi:hypothetical protein
MDKPRGLNDTLATEEKAEVISRLSLLLREVLYHWSKEKEARIRVRDHRSRATGTEQHGPKLRGAQLGTSQRNIQLDTTASS